MYFLYILLACIALTYAVDTQNGMGLFDVDNSITYVGNPINLKVVLNQGRPSNTYCHVQCGSSQPFNITFLPYLPPYVNNPTTINVAITGTWSAGIVACSVSTYGISPALTATHDRTVFAVPTPTTAALTTRSLTTKSVTSSALTTKSVTSSALTTKSITSAAITTQSQGSTVPSPPPPSSSVTTHAVSPTPVTTSFVLNNVTTSHTTSLSNDNTNDDDNKDKTTTIVAAVVVPVAVISVVIISAILIRRYIMTHKKNFKYGKVSL